MPMNGLQRNLYGRRDHKNLCRSTKKKEMLDYLNIRTPYLSQIEMQAFLIFLPAPFFRIGVNLRKFFYGTNE